MQFTQFMLRSFAVVWVLCVGCLLSGCQTGPRIYDIPTHIDFDVATGAWSVVTSGTGGVEQLPQTIPVFSTWQGERREGVWVVLGSDGAKKILVFEKRGYKDDDRSWDKLEVPDVIDPVSGGLRIILSDKEVGVAARDWSTTPPLKMIVPVLKRFGEKNAGSGIEHRAGRI